jgi:hypothetical protein
MLTYKIVLLFIQRASKRNLRERSIQLFVLVWELVGFAFMTIVRVRTKWLGFWFGLGEFLWMLGQLKYE